MALSDEGHAKLYLCSTSSVDELLHRVAKRVFELPRENGAFQDPEHRESDWIGSTFLFSERSPGIHCVARVTTRAPSERYLELDFSQAQTFKDIKEWNVYWMVSEAQELETYRALKTIGKQIKVSIGLGSASEPVMTEQERSLLTALASRETRGRIHRVEDPVRFLRETWREVERKRFKVGESTHWRRPIYIEIDKQKPEDLFFQLGLVSIQEQLILNAEAQTLQIAMVSYLCTKFKSCRNLDVAHRVLTSALKNFVEPYDWRGFWRHLKKTADGLAINKLKEDTSPERQSKFIDPEGRVYAPTWVARELDADIATIYRRIKQHGDTTASGRKGLSEGQFVDLRWELRERGRLADTYADARGISRKSALRQFNRLEEKGLSREQIRQKVQNAAMQLREGAEVSVSSENPPSLEDQFAAYKAYFSHPEADRQSEEYAQAMDDVEELLRQQQDLDP